MGTTSPRENCEEGTEAPVSFTDSSGGVTPGIFAQPATPTNRAVILCHGFPSDKNSRTNRRLTQLLVPRSIATLRFDWYGMGESPERLAHFGIQKCAEQLDAAFRFVAGRDIHTLGLIGSSFGGFMAILSASRYPQLQALGLAHSGSEPSIRAARRFSSDDHPSGRVDDRSFASHMILVGPVSCLTFNTTKSNYPKSNSKFFEYFTPYLKMKFFDGGNT
ncbi:MAG: alpha/beta hydrolase [Nitrospirales bacterium]